MTTVEKPRKSGSGARRALGLTLGTSALCLTLMACGSTASTMGGVGGSAQPLTVPALIDCDYLAQTLDLTAVLGSGMPTPDADPDDCTLNSAVPQNVSTFRVTLTDSPRESIAAWEDVAITDPEETFKEPVSANGWAWGLAYLDRIAQAPGLVVFMSEPNDAGFRLECVTALEGYDRDKSQDLERLQERVPAVAQACTDAMRASADRARELNDEAANRPWHAGD